ncbi:alpha/beta hydrolase fold domain-containing protein [Actinomadura sp. LD22]|uniref:Alpha/beta hydrolase fold domain-containing protein n=1 Tax=Actinomadura physcomitrii TaxID=2650748 RepID=A0A6I4MBL9_9ACTN|nr:alpha/beta hydrolase [Actinomadura physcomitrii]MWA03192.1 alpha/beta hydrolase fold domain-containing protein [Actinomadura physcomitrii]
MAYAFDPELAASVAGLPVTDLADLAAARAHDAPTTAIDLPDQYRGAVTASTQTAPAVRGGPPAVLSVYRPSAPGPRRSAVLAIHGGGFVVGAHRGYARECCRLVTELGAVVVAVHYRLAPEHPFPAAFLDCLAALSWMHDHADGLGIDPGRVAVVGDSAGGALAAGLCLYARDHQGPPISFQFLGIPVLDDRLRTASMTRFVDTPLWHRGAAELSWRYYLAGGTKLGDADGLRYAAPARAEDLAGLPPAAIAICEFDPLRDEGLIYGQRLLAAGVSTEIHHYAGTFHGSTLLWRAAVSKRMWRDRIEALTRALRAAPVRTPPRGA